MKFLFTSDKFSYIHPNLPPRKTNSYSKEELNKAVENTEKVKFSKKTFELARNKSDGKMPSNQIGSIIVFPSVDKKHRKTINDFVKSTFKNVESKLTSEYSEKSDPTCYYEITDDGSCFSARFENKNGIKKDVFDKNSLSIYVAGCLDTTAEYLFEELIDSCYTDSEKHDKKITKSNGSEDDKIGFDVFRSFLIYSFNSCQFHQIGVKENELYEAQRRKHSVLDEYDVMESPLVMSTMESIS